MHQTTTTNNKSVHLPGKGDEIVRRQVHSGFLRSVFYIDILGIFLRKFSCNEIRPSHWQNYSKTFLRNKFVDRFVAPSDAVSKRVYRIVCENF